MPGFGYNNTGLTAAVAIINTMNKRNPVLFKNGAFGGDIMAVNSHVMDPFVMDPPLIDPSVMDTGVCY